MEWSSGHQTELTQAWCRARLSADSAEVTPLSSRGLGACRIVLAAEVSELIVDWMREASREVVQIALYIFGCVSLIAVSLANWFGGFWKLAVRQSRESRPELQPVDEPDSGMRFVCPSSRSPQRQKQGSRPMGLGRPALKRCNMIGALMRASMNLLLGTRRQVVRRRAAAPSEPALCSPADANLDGRFRTWRPTERMPDALASGLGRTKGVHLLACVVGLVGLAGCAPSEDLVRPNILILMSDNHSWDHVGCYGDPTVRTPNIDKVAEEGVRFTHAFCPAPSCTPARAAMLTGQDIWRLEEGANLWGTLPNRFTVYTDLLEQAGYLVGYEGKGWGPGNYEAGGWARNPGGEMYGSFEEFYNERERGQPFCYWFSSRDPHRPYRREGGQKAGIALDSIQVPPYLPDAPSVRADISDYYAEIEHFDTEVGGHLALLSEFGATQDTAVIVASDNGWQMPRGLANLYDAGTRLPLIISLPGRFPGGRVIGDFVSLADFAPTILELAGLAIPQDVTAKSLVPILTSDRAGVVDPERSFVVTARERHAFVRRGGPGYPARALRTRDYLYIRNYAPDLWPAGDPPLYGDVDAHMLHYPSPTKMFLLRRPDDPEFRSMFDLAFSKRTAEELYDLADDPHQMNNLAQDASYASVKAQLASQLQQYLQETEDPREVGGAMKWDNAKYFSERDMTPEPSPEAIEALGLEDRYSYLE